MSENVIKFIGADDIGSITNRLEFIFANYGYPLDQCLAMVLMNYGESFVKVKCVNGEWEGTKGDLPRSEGIPKCPNGHVLLETSNAPRLALVNVEE